MFDSLSDRLSGTLDGLRSKGRLTEADIDRAMREIRLALLEADVNFRVVKDFVARVKERALGADVMSSLTPGQQVVKIVHEELSALMGAAGSKLSFSNRPPTVILMAGLQGSGKTTACAKLARLLAKSKRTPAMVACDVYRPAAIQQLQMLGRSLNVPVYERGADADPVQTAAWGIEQARAQGRDVVIVDTAGRLHIDETLMDELVRIKAAVRPHNVLLVLDSMTGQDAVNVASRFSEAVDYDGVILTKLDGDTRGGAALSVRAVTGKPIKFASVGEKLDQLEEFHPDRLASRILGMGDVLSLIERAQEQFDEQAAVDMEAKLRRAEFTLDDWLKMLRQVRGMGPLQNLLGMMPGMGRQLKDLRANVDERQMDRVEAIILSMTPSERRNAKIIDGSRRRRIAAGSGTTVQQVNLLLQQFRQVQKMMKQVTRTGRLPQIPGLTRR